MRYDKHSKKEQGIKLGRPKGPGKSKLDRFRPEIEALLAKGSTQKFIADRYNTTEANLHNWLKKKSQASSHENPLKHFYPLETCHRKCKIRREEVELKK